MHFRAMQRALQFTQIELALLYQLPASTDCMCVEMRCTGQSVPRSQHVMGVEFSYQPPPRNVVPFAAALKGHIQR